MLSKVVQRHVRNALAIAPHYGLDPSTTAIPAVEWVCRQFDIYAAMREQQIIAEDEHLAHLALHPDLWGRAQAEVVERTVQQRAALSRKAKLWRKWSAEVRALGVPAELLAEYGWRV